MIRCRGICGLRSGLASPLLLVVAFSVAAGLPASAQDFDRYRPDPLPPGAAAPLLSTPADNFVSGSTDVLVGELKGIMILDDESRIQDPIKEFRGVRIDPAAILTVARETAFQEAVSPYLGQPITIHTLNQMAHGMVLLYRDFQQPVVDVNIPPGQDITDGVVQVVITESRIGSVQFRGNCNFSDCVLQQQSCLRPGQRIFVPCLHDELVWFNRNSFRTVSATLEPGSVAGTTDIVYDVLDERPVRAFVGYTDSGVRRTGLERIVTGFNWGNAFGKDHELSYQYTADAELRGVIGVHSLFYEAAIFENRDSWTMFGTWADIDSPSFSQAQGWQLSGRYNHTLHQTTCRDDSMHFGFDVKGTDNDLDFGGTTVVDSDLHVAQFMAGVSSQQIYSDGQTLYGLDGFFSPGHLLNGNNDGSFSQLRPGAGALYAYARGYVEGQYDVDCRSEFFARATAQFSTYKLLPTEQLGFGGYNSIRGYDMRATNGDSGYIVNLEYRTKPIRTCTNGSNTALTMLAFTDIGQQFNWNEAGNGSAPFSDEILASVGVGLRYVVDRNITFRLDYGLPVTFPQGVEKVAAQRGGRVHLGAIVAF